MRWGNIERIKEAEGQESPKKAANNLIYVLMQRYKKIANHVYLVIKKQYIYFNNELKFVLNLIIIFINNAIMVSTAWKTSKVL